MVLKGSKVTICEVPDINFGHILFRETEGVDTEVLCLDDVSYEDFNSYLNSLLNSGFIKKENHKLGVNSFFAFSFENVSLIVSYYPNVGQMRLVAQLGNIDLNYYDSSKEEIVSSKLTMLDIPDYAESMTLRLRDGRFIVFDGGYRLEEYADILMETLSAQTPHEKPVIAAWIITHPHVDHYRCVLSFYPKYKDDVVIEKFIYNFPEANDELYKNVPALTEYYTDEIECMKEFEEMVAETKAIVYRAHTGQIFNISNAKIEMLSTLDDVMLYPCDPNIFSLVFKMTIENQVILFGSDGLFDESLLAERYRDYLKSDILQLPHHGFNYGEIEAYKFINPDVCIIENSEEIFFRQMCIYYDGNKALISDLNLKDVLIGGNGNIVLDLPYSPREHGKTLLFEKIRSMQKEIGAKAWFFTDMTLTDCKFSFINSTRYDVEVVAYLYYEDLKYHKVINNLIAKPRRVTKIDFENPEPDMILSNGEPLSNKHFPDGEKFTVRFQCKEPVVISSPKKADYIG